ncbi:MAG: hypothetical protein JO211_11660, partial [Acidobacteriaceae bacterium]|nr:hypothetical protein [Acidobacteriaceae bacterium]
MSHNLSILILFIFAASLAQPQHAQLGTPPLPAARTNVAAQAETSVQPAATSGNWIDISNRQTVQSSYLNTYLPTAGVAMNWTGSVAADNPGTTSQAYQNAVDARINWFRGMAGVPAGITLNASYSQQDQAAALMFSANNQISHSPPSTWTDYSSAGANAAANSNICLYYGQGWTDSGCIALYIQDGGSNNTAAGHRRWLLYPQTQQMGTGDVPVNGSNDGANAVWVFDGNYGTTRPPTRDGFVAWPPPGYVPYQVVYPRWSFSYPNADFSNATVTMTTQGTSVPVTLQPLANGYGENTLVWVPNNEDPNSNFNPVAPSGDTTTSITISNVVVNGSAQTFSYSVIVFDPGQTSCSYSLGQSGQHFASSGGSGNVSVSAGSGCAWMASANATWISITSGSSGSGNGTVNYTVSPNTSTQSRSGTISVEGQTFTISQDAASSGPTALRFVPVTPCRVADTRNANGTFGGPYLSGGTSRDFAIPNSKCGIPATAQAYSLNVTAVPLGGFNYLSVWPSGEPQPNVSTLNSTDGRVKANAAIVAAGNNGAVSVYATDSTQVILDIDGYFVPATNTAALAFYPMTSCRVVDTRQGSAPFGGPALNASETRTFPMLSSGCNIPSTAQAYSLNVTAVPRGQLWYLTAWPSGFSQP